MNIERPDEFKMRATGVPDSVDKQRNKTPMVREASEVA
jgi:hypothetical protein